MDYGLDGRAGVSNVAINGLSETKRFLAALKGQIPYATSVALNKTGKEAIEAQKEEMRGVFDRPTPYALGSLFKTTATKKKLETRTRIKSPSPAEVGQSDERYIGVQIHGGKRKDKASERRLRSLGLLPGGYQMVPGKGLRLNQYGNVPGGRVAAILKALVGAEFSKSFTTAAGTFVVGEVGGTTGVWKVQQNKWVPIFIFVKAPSYTPRFDYYRVSNDVFKKRWKPIFDAALADALKTAR